MIQFLPRDPQYVSLQIDSSESERALLASAGIYTLLSSSADLSDTAGLIDCLDVVITVDTSIAHLSGALGRETWLLLPYSPDWRWLLGRNDSPWYQSVHLFRQEVAGNWNGPLARTEEALVALKTRDV